MKLDSEKIKAVQEEIENLNLLERKNLRYRLLDSSGSGLKILVACFPKSGSTWLSNLLARLYGIDVLTAVQPRALQNEQDLYDTFLAEHKDTSFILHQHARATDRSLELIRHYKISTIVLVRDILDTIISLYDFIQSQGPSGSIPYLPDVYFEMSNHEKLTFLARNFTPWYMNHIQSWEDASNKHRFHWTTYETLMGAPLDEIDRICKHIGEKPRVSIESALADLASSDTRKNVGISGRGAIELNDEQKNIISAIIEDRKLAPSTLEKIGKSL